jgi:octaprenyl-diphosphate synthase
MVLDAGGMACLELLNRTIHTIVEGELLQFLRVGFTELDEGHYREIIRRKTAQLISTSCRLGALPGPGKRFASPLARFGNDLGMAFQMMDDLLDYTAEQKTLGKKVGTDFREAKMTLPLITALSRCSRPEQSELLELLHGDPVERDHAFPWAKDLIQKHGGFQFTHRSAVAHAERAVEAIRDLPAVRERYALAHLARFVVERTY